MNHNRPIDRFVAKSLSILQKEYVVIGKRRVSSFTAWTIIAFFVGITVAIAFLASRSGELQGSFAASKSAILGFKVIGAEAVDPAKGHPQTIITITKKQGRKIATIGSYTDNPYNSGSISRGTYTISSTVPEGYEVSHYAGSFFEGNPDNNKFHDPSAYTKGNSVTINTRNFKDDVVHLWWRYELPKSWLSFYVSPAGNDANPGTLAQPFKTLEKARDTVRTLNVNMAEDITIYLRGGPHERTEPFLLDERDSGSNGFFVIYKNYPGEKPILSGGKVVTGWVQDGNKWKAQVGASVNTRQLYVNGLRAIRARSTGGLPGAKKTLTGYTTTDANVQNWQNISDIELVAKNDWKLFRCGMESISGTTVVMKQPCWDSAQLHKEWPMNEPTWIENAYELLDQPGEWYHNRVTGWLYYIPRSDENMSVAVAVVPVLEALVQGNGKLDNPIHNIKFQELTFTHSTWLGPSASQGFPELQANIYFPNPDWNAVRKIPSAVAFTVAKSVIFERNIFRHLGSAALEFARGSKDNLIVGNKFSDISGNAIQLGEIDNPKTGDERDMPTNNQIRNNFIRNIAVEYKGGVGIWVGYARNTLVAHNEIVDVPYTGISVGWGWGYEDPSFARDNRVEFNLIHNHVNFMFDGGGIYTLGAQPGSVIEANVIRDQINEYGAMYLDSCSRYFTVKNNVVVNNKRSVLVKGGDHVIQDNYWQDRFPNDIWWYADELDELVCIPTPSGPNNIRNNRIIGDISEAPASIVNTVGLEPAYQNIKQ